MSRVFISDRTGAGIYGLLGRPLPGARSRSPSRRRLDRAREILVPRQYGGARQHHPGQERSSTTRSEPPFERRSSATA